MLDKRFILILFLLFIAIGMLSSVSADDSAEDVLSNATCDEIGIDENDDLGNDDVEILESVSEADEDALGAAGTFTELQNMIANAAEGSTISLNKDYSYDQGFHSSDSIVNWGITIDKSLTINGNGHIIDGLSRSMLINTAASNVRLTNIVFKNGYGAGYAPVIWSGSNNVIDNSRFENCAGMDLGGAIVSAANDNTITNCVFNNCHANTGGAIYLTGSRTTVSNCVFNDCNTTKYGGAIYVDPSKTTVYDCTVTGCNFTNCISDKGGAVCWNCSNGVLSNCRFIQCSANDGAAILWDNVNGAVTQCRFDRCTASSVSTVYWKGSKGKIENCNFNDCSAVHAAAVYWHIDLNDGTITNSNFNHCSADNMGGAVAWEGKNGVVTKCNFDECSGKNGGAIYTSKISFTASYCSFDDCSAYDGGAIKSTGNSFKASYCNFTGCNANYSGAICSEGDNSVVSYCRFTGSSAVASGGAIYWDTINGKIDNCNFEGSSARSGGAIYMSTQASGNTLSNSNFRNSHATNYGGDILWCGIKGVIRNCNFTKSSCDNYAGAVYWDVQNGKIDNCKFDECDSIEGGAVYWSSKASGGTVSNSNFNNCYATNFGGAIEWRSGSATISNSKFNNCHSNAGGAILLMQVNTANVNGCKFTGNHATTSINSGGGAIYAYNITGFKLTSSDFNDNYGSMSGGAVFVSYGYNPQVSSCNFANNYVLNETYGSGGALIINKGENAVITSCSFVENSAKNCGGVGVMDCNADIISCKFTRNTGEYGSAISGEANAIDCTFEGNSEPDTYEAKLFKGSQLTVKQSGSFFNNKVVTVILKGTDGAVLSSQNIKVVLNGKQSTIRTDSKGQASFKVTLPAKTYAATITYAGNDKYYTSSAKISVVIKKATPKLTAAKKTFKLKVKTKKYTVTLKDNLGKAMKSKTVKLTVKGKTFSAKTNSKGQATFKITNLKKKGSFTATVKYAGDSYFNKASKSVKITVKK